MTNKEVSDNKKKIVNILQQHRIHEALPAITTLVENSSSWELKEELSNIKYEYKCMLDYFSEGIIDTEREKIYNGFIQRLYLLVDKTASDILTREDYNLYYGIKRSVKKNGYTLTSLLRDYEKAVNEYNLYSEVDSAERDVNKTNSLLKTKEMTECELFKYVWTSFPQNTIDINSLKTFFESETYPTYLKSLIVSAILLSLMQYYNESLLVLLLNNYNSDDVNLSMKSLCVAIIVMFMYKERVKDSTSVATTLDAMCDNPQFTSDVKNLLYLLIRSKNTERITKKVEEELIPKLMKIYPKVFKKFKSNNVTIDLSDLESNPQWKDMLERDGITKKIDELNKLQMEGSDVFIGTFSHLKSFPFFSEVSNWFLPFHQDHSMFAGVLGNNESKLIDMILDSRFFCDSDKYSFIASMTSVPESQRSMMLSQLNEQSNALQELKNSELPASHSIKRETVANLYIQNLYRFFKLFPRKSEFADPFNNSFDITGIDCLTQRMDMCDTIQVIGEFYLKNEYYKEAIKYFKTLYSLKPDCNASILQKTGFCYQNLEDYNRAIDYYKKYELLADKDLWNLRHMAACYRALKNPETALRYYCEAESLSPDNIAICLNIGHCLLELERYEDALKYYYKVYYLEPDSPRVWRPIAWCLFVQGNFEQSHIYYDKIVQDKPNSLDYMNYGHLYFAEGKIKDAISMYRKSIENGSKSLSVFVDDYNADENTLIKLGVKKSDISILLDALFHLYD